MKDYFKNEIHENDIVENVVDEYHFKKGTKWQVICYGIEPSTKKEIAVIKTLEGDFLVCCYSSEIKFFKKNI